MTGAWSPRRASALRSSGCRWSASVCGIAHTPCDVASAEGVDAEAPMACGTAKLPSFVRSNRRPFVVHHRAPIQCGAGRSAAAARPGDLPSTFDRRREVGVRNSRVIARHHQSQQVGIDTDGWEQALKNTLRRHPSDLMARSATAETMETQSRWPKPATCVWRPCMPTARTRRGPHHHFFPEERRAQLLMTCAEPERAGLQA